MSTPPRIQALHIVHAGLADVRHWLGETTEAERDADLYVPRHAATWGAPAVTICQEAGR